MMTGKKPGLSIVVGMGKKPMHDEDDEDEEYSGDDESKMAAASELAEIIGVPEDKHEDFMHALDAYVKACM